MPVDIDEGGLNTRQRAFVNEYLIDLNASAAALRAGYAAKSAPTIGHHNLHKPKVAAAIQAAMDARTLRLQRSADDVLRDIGRVRENAMRVTVNPDTQEERMADRPAALKALELEGKHLKMFTDRTELSGPDGAAIDHNLTVRFVD